MNETNKGWSVYLLVITSLFFFINFDNSFCADMIFINGNIITVDNNFSVAKAIAITGNKIEKVGSNSEILKLSESHTKVIDLKGKTFLPLNSMIKAGIIVSGGSDHMVKFDSYSAINPYNPFLGMYSLITRKKERGNVINYSEAITREDAIKMYTINNAYGSFEEDAKGSLEEGKLADLIVLSDNLLICPEEHIKNINVLLTMFNGKIIHDTL